MVGRRSRQEYQPGGIWQGHDAWVCAGICESDGFGLLSAEGSGAFGVFEEGGGVDVSCVCFPYTVN